MPVITTPDTPEHGPCDPEIIGEPIEYPEETPIPVTIPVPKRAPVPA